MASEYIINLKNISKTFGGVKALDGVSLDIKRGEVHALVGENGAGKSTLIKVLAGVHFPDDGAEIYINGERTMLRNPMDAIRKGISVIYQDISLFPNLTVAENICIGNDIVWKAKLNWPEIRQLAAGAIAKVGASIDPAMLLKDLNLASQQIVAIARAISFNASLIIMDELLPHYLQEKLKIYIILLKICVRAILRCYLSVINLMKYIGLRRVPLFCVMVNSLRPMI